MKMLLASMLVGAMALQAITAYAQTVYRCGPDGRSYSQAPCAQGTAVDVGDARSAEQRAASIAVAKEEQARGERMAREREKQEHAVKPAKAGVIAPAVKAEAPASSAKPKAKKKKRSAKDEPNGFRAVAPAKKTP